MQIVNLYRYEDESGVVTITPTPKTETDTPSRLRLIADDGMILTDGHIKTPVVDITLDSLENWREVTEAEKEQAEKVTEIIGDE